MRKKTGYLHVHLRDILIDFWMLLKDRRAPRAEEKERGAELKAAPLPPPGTHKQQTRNHITNKEAPAYQKAHVQTCTRVCLPKTWSKGAVIGDKWTEALQSPAHELGVPPLTIANTLFSLLFIVVCWKSLSLSFSSTSPLARSILAANQPPFSTARPSLAFNHAEKAQPCAHWQSCIKQAGVFFVSVICR